MSEVTIRYWAAAKEAAGMPEESVAAVTLADALDAVLAGRESDTRLREVLARSSFLIDGTRANKAAAESITLSNGAVIEVLPPFAGG
ncbi:MAG TPA: MoaD/ThiS family protein [Trebonia sp.]|jgi:molybdopterin converting factor small subunit|nr:MoaD/ThiS family protein [Trebonia sp.]